MKNSIHRLLYLFIGAAVLLSACRKDPVINRHDNGNDSVTGSNSFRFITDSLPTETNPVTGLYAIVTVLNAQQQPVLTDKKLALQHNGKYVSDSLILGVGTYTVSKYIIVAADSITRFATPVAGSAKAGMVQSPLPVSFAVVKQTATIVPIAVARVAPGDQPESFGYHAGSFNNPRKDEPEDPNATISIKVHPIIKIGDVVYDSVPVSYTMTTWNAAGQATTTSGTWAPGKNDVALLRAAVKYRISVSKWGTADEMTLEKKDLLEGTVYVLGGSRAAKKLTSVLTYTSEGNNYIPTTRDVYEYNGSGKLSRILNYKKKADNTVYIDITEQFHYNGVGKVDGISRYAENNTLYSETGFQYNQQGKIIHMEQQEGGVQTTADVQYTALPGSTGITGNYGIGIVYHYSDRYYTMNYGMTFQGGDNIEDYAATSHQNYEGGLYQYDFNINPYIHINRPDIFLSQYSKNNVIAQTKTYATAFPQVIAYDFVYTYDGDGYPKEVIKSYKSYTTGKFLYKMKTVYNY